MADSTTKRTPRTDLPKKPKDFPLGAHPSGLWQKRIRGKLYYFGPWRKKVEGKWQRLPNDGRDEALARYRREAPFLHEGKEPPAVREGALTVKELVNRFLTEQTKRVQAGTLSTRSFRDLLETGKRIVDSFGRDQLVEDLGPRHFADFYASFPKTWSLVTQGNVITRTKVVFNWADKMALIERRVRFGPAFMKTAPGERPERIFEADEIRAMLAVANPRMSAAILLGINGGLGNSDVSRLPLSAIDLERGILQFPRPKTGVRRIVTLWPETLDAIRQVIAERPTPRVEADADLVFLTAFGRCWVRGKSDAVGSEFKKVMTKANIESKTGRGFYSLRHSHATIADEVGDTTACCVLMGHAVAGIRRFYVHGTNIERLKKVTDHVRSWLFPTPKAEGGEA